MDRHYRLSGRQSEYLRGVKVSYRLDPAALDGGSAASRAIAADLIRKATFEAATAPKSPSRSRQLARTNIAEAPVLRSMSLRVYEQSEPNGLENRICGVDVSRVLISGTNGDHGSIGIDGTTGRWGRWNSASVTNLKDRYLKLVG
jgi:hypothetical protein